MSKLLAPEGRLVCLEFPSGKPLSMPGPPWGLNSGVYLALLARPGEEVSYEQSGEVRGLEAIIPRADGLSRLELIKPRRTHRSGMNEDGTVNDFISVWRHRPGGSG
jgi:methyl halide transferase